MWFRDTTFPQSLLFHFYLLAHCSSLVSSLLLSFLLPFILHTCIPCISWPCTWYIPRSSHELGLFYRPIVFVFVYFYLFIYQLYLLTYSVFSFSHIVSIHGFLCLRYLHLLEIPPSAFHQRSTGNCSAPASCQLHQLLYINL